MSVILAIIELILRLIFGDTGGIPTEPTKPDVEEPGAEQPGTEDPSPDPEEPNEPDPDPEEPHEPEPDPEEPQLPSAPSHRYYVAMNEEEGMAYTIIEGDEAKSVYDFLSDDLDEISAIFDLFRKHPEGLLVP